MCCVMLLSWSALASGQTTKPLPPAVRKQIRDIDKAILAAGRLFNADKFDESGKVIGKAQKSMVALTESADARTIEVVKGTYKRLTKAYQLLTNKGQKLEPLMALPEPKAMTTGKVSFVSHVAPILLENCATCHIARNPRANFSMANFAAILRGGNGGKVFVPGNSATSEIVLRLNGVERSVMPPSGKLDDELIERVAKWIDDGAKFDPADVQLDLKTVADKGLANTLDHLQLSKHRKQTSAQTWQLALSDVHPSSASTENFHIVGTGSTDRLQQIGNAAEDIAHRIEKILKTSPGTRFVKGNTTLFVVDKRYDFAEFGRMVEKRTFAKNLVSSWQSDTAIAHVVLLCGIKDGVADYEVSLTRDIASVHVANWDASVPRWFADGVGHWVATQMFKRAPMVQQWRSDSQAAMASIKKPSDFLTNQMAADQAVLVGYRFVEMLQGKSRQFKMLVKKLRDGSDFESAFQNSYGITPAEFFQGAAKKW